MSVACEDSQRCEDFLRVEPRRHFIRIPHGHHIIDVAVKNAPIAA